MSVECQYERWCPWTIRFHGGSMLRSTNSMASSVGSHTTCFDASSSSVLFCITSRATLCRILCVHGLHAGCFGQICCNNQLQSSCMGVGISVWHTFSQLQFNVCNSSQIYRKTMRLRGTGVMCEVMNLISRDCFAVLDGCLYFHYFWAAFPSMCAALTYMIQLSLRFSLQR
jgi:hypothetical protein